MKIPHAMFASFLALTSFMGDSRAQTPLPWKAEVAIPSSHRLKFTSPLTGESYTLFVRIPFTPPPPEGYPVIYVLDGDQLFGMAADLSQVVLGPRAPVIVGIGHDTFSDVAVIARNSGRKPGDTMPWGFVDVARSVGSLRFHDLTLPVAPPHRAPEWMGLTPANVGGVDQFLKVIESEVKPRVRALTRIDDANQTLFGHSIAGLAVLRALFTQPGAFRTFVAASPSLWWDGDAVLKDETAFRKNVESGKVAPRILLTVGASEPDSPNPPASFIATLPPDRAASLEAYLKVAGSWSGMVSGTRNLAARLGKLHGSKEYKVDFISFADETHAGVLPAAMSRGMRFAIDR